MGNSTPDMSLLLVRYMDGELEGAEMTTVEEQLSVNASWQEELLSLRGAREALNQYGLQQQVAGIHRQMMEELRFPARVISPARKFLRYSVAVAASIILVAGSIIAYNFYRLSPGKVFAANYYPYEPATSRDNGAAMSVVEKTYRDKQYAEVTKLTPRPGDVQDAFLVAMAWLEVKNIPQAINGFQQVNGLNKAAGTVILQDDTEYYLALAYISNRDYDLALELLEKIRTDPGHTYHQKITAKLIRQVKALKWR